MTIEYIKNTVNTLSGVDIANETQVSYTVFCRWVFFDLCKKFLKNSSHTTIGSAVNRDHASVTHGIGSKNKTESRLEQLLKENKEIRLIHSACVQLLSKEIKINIDDIECIEEMKLFHKTEILKVANAFREDMVSFETMLKNKYENINKIDDRVFVKKLLSLPNYLIDEFEETRIKPFLIMNKNVYKN